MRQRSTLSEIKKIDEHFPADDETVPSGEVATSVSLSVYLRASSLCLRNAGGGVALCLPRLSHGLQSEISVIWHKQTHTNNHILTVAAQTQPSLLSLDVSLSLLVPVLVSVYYHYIPEWGREINTPS